LSQRSDSLVFVAGTGRSGTTWLAQLINAKDKFRLIVEPFHPESGVPAVRTLPRYIRPSDDRPGLVAPASAVLFSYRNRRVIPRRRLIKDIHSNLRLGWFRAQFPNFRLILLIRHPCAVAVSQRRRAGHDAGWDFDLDAYLSEPGLVSDHLGDVVGELGKLRDDFARRIAQWCIETSVPLRQFRHNRELIVTFYEDLVTEPVRVSKLLERIGVQAPNSLDEHLVRPSTTTWRQDEWRLESPDQAITDWTKRVSGSEVRRTLDLLELFGLDSLYGEDPFPLPETNLISAR